MKSAVVKRSVVLSGHRTSVSLEDTFWLALREIARNRGVSVSGLVGQVDGSREHVNLSSALRLYVFEQFRRPVGAAPNPTGTATSRVSGPV
jgi:predicted DNA-binding ribbon-helix-helix protein